MRRLGMLRWTAFWAALWMVWTGSAAFAARPVTADQLLQFLNRVSGETDGRIARLLERLELTEPVSGATLEAWEQRLPGTKSRRSLVMLVDMEAFRESPAASVVGVPDADTQNHMLKLSVDYITSMVPHLPDLTATRATEYFEEARPVGEDGAGVPALYDLLHPVGNITDMLLYRDGKEVAEPIPALAKSNDPPPGRPLETRGVFGPILSVVMQDAVRSKLFWSRWEMGESGPEAVFRYTVARGRSHYEIFCCQDLSVPKFKDFPAYHGELALDPVTGAVLRILLIADLEPLGPVKQSGILVEYAPVVIRGTTYICPVRSVALAEEWERGWRTRMTSLNDVVYTEYHRFGTESKVIIEDAAEKP